MNILLSEKFETKLGIIETRIESNLSDSIIAKENNTAITTNYKIVLQNFELTDKIRDDAFGTAKKVQSAVCWRWFIEKVSDVDEQLNIFCELINPQSDILWDAASGENLDSVEIENATHHLHIGTEDGNIMQYRAL